MLSPVRAVALPAILLLLAAVMFVPTAPAPCPQNYSDCAREVNRYVPNPTTSALPGAGGGAAVTVVVGTVQATVEAAAEAGDSAPSADAAVHVKAGERAFVTYRLLNTDLMASETMEATLEVGEAPGIEWLEMRTHELPVEPNAVLQGSFEFRAASNLDAAALLVPITLSVAAPGGQPAHATGILAVDMKAEGIDWSAMAIPFLFGAIAGALVVYLALRGRPKSA
ncbi:MAG TPA: hypothetical protein VI796_03010 [Candidatus Thermoplasmatota archaeon]|nr:hypothetical protein [Candidatus Thermoplasmatota archaeon]